MRHARWLVVPLLLGVTSACSDGTAPHASGGVAVLFSLHTPAGVSPEEEDVLASAFDRVDSYSIAVADSTSGVSILETSSAVVSSGGGQHELTVVLPESTIGLAVLVTVVGLDDDLELYRTAGYVRVEATTSPTPVVLSLRYTGPGLRGTVVDETGAPRGGITVELLQGITLIASVVTEADGTYLFLPESAGGPLATGQFLVRPEPSGGYVCPVAQSVTVTESSSLVADFTTQAAPCQPRLLVLSGGDVDDTQAVAAMFDEMPDMTAETFFFVNQAPGLDYLSQFEAVLLFSNGQFNEAVTLGSEIKGYVDAGGNLVVATFYWQNRSDSDLSSPGWGTLESIDPFLSTGGATYQAATLGEVSPHALTEGVRALSATGYRGGAAAKTDAEVVAYWDDGTPLVGYRVLGGGQRIVGVTLFPGCCATGDVESLWQNAVRWAAFGGTAQGASVWTDFALGAGHTCGLVEDGRAYCWGGNSFGQLGSAGIAGGAAPQLATAAHRFVSIEAGGNTTCGLTHTGTAYCWGDNQVGQVGSGSTAPTTAPERVQGGPWERLAVGIYHVCALDATGAASCWGGGGAQSLGRDLALGFAPPDTCVTGNSYLSERCSRIPRPVETATTFSDIGPGLFTTCGVATDRAILCWGLANFGQLGVGPYSNDDSRSDPQPVSSATDFRSVSGGALHVCAVALTDDAYCWGGTLPDGEGGVRSTLDAGQVGQGGTGGSSPPAPAPSPVVGGLSFGSVSASVGNSIDNLFTCGLTVAGAAYCWGRESAGELGGTTPPPTCDDIAFGPGPCTTSPLPVQGGHTFVELETDLRFACARTGAGRLYCWGANESGQRGDPSLMSSPVPTEVLAPGT